MLPLAVAVDVAGARTRIATVVLPSVVAIVRRPVLALLPRLGLLLLMLRRLARRGVEGAAVVGVVVVAIDVAHAVAPDDDVRIAPNQ